jgi:hypothetical protein
MAETRSPDRQRTPTNVDKLARALAFALGSLVLLPSYVVFLALLALGWSQIAAAGVGFLPVLLVIPPLVLRLERRLQPIVARALDRSGEADAEA